MRNQSGTSLGFGFVCFKEAGSASKALNELNGSDGIYVRQALPKRQREAEIKKTTERFKTSMVRFNLYFKNFPKNSTEEELKEYFSQFGEIKSLKLMREQKVLIKSKPVPIVNSQDDLVAAATSSQDESAPMPPSQ